MRRTAAQLERDRTRALEMRRSGKNTHVIATELNISLRRAQQLVKLTTPATMPETRIEPGDRAVQKRSPVLPLPVVAKPVLQVDELDERGLLKRRPGEDELSWRIRWRRLQLDQQRVENALTNRPRILIAATPAACARQHFGSDEAFRD